MPTITEEYEGDDFPDFAQLLGGVVTEQNGLQAGHPNVQESTTGRTQPAPNCACHDGMSEWDLPDPSADPLAGLEEPDYSRFENWIPKFVRPDKPCEYCRSKRLACYKTRGEVRCTACSTLFRECSLESHPPELVSSDQNYFLDTLHVVDEDTVKDQGTSTGTRPLISKGRSSSAANSIRADDEPGSSWRNGIRFPRHAVKILRDWVDAHADDPYPSEAEKAELERKTDLKPNQVANWLANARRRRKAQSKSRPKVCASPSLGPCTPAIDIPGIEANKPWDELNPFERWRHSPPENEPASAMDIVHAMAEIEPLDDASTSPSTQGRRRKRSSNDSAFSNVRAPSSTSLETSSLSASNSAHHSAHSSNSHGSFGSFSSGLAGKRDRRRRRRAPATRAVLNAKAVDDKKRIFSCTFCTDTFKSKYDWTRHEKSLHISLEKWLCAPLGPKIADPTTGRQRCVYCDEVDPSDEHLETHNHRQCEEKGRDARTFYRKDHLRQHLRLMHNCEMTPFMDTWKSVVGNINCRCGFCGQRFSVWQERVDHLTAHFKAGMRMGEWKGCRGLDPAVAAQVTDAMPPYLIGVEARSPVPYSATNTATWRHGIPRLGSELRVSGAAPPMDHDGFIFRQAGPAPDVFGAHVGTNATCWEILTIRLGKFANDMAQQGVVVTDAMLQSKSRRILYGTDDPWEQTAADNPEWLDLFKKAHGLNFIPNAIGGGGQHVPEDLETYGDLGLRIPFSVRLDAYNQDQANSEQCTCPQILGVHTMTDHPKISQELRKIYKHLASEGVLHDPNRKCAHRECDQNVVDVSAIDSSSTGPKQLRWCIYELPADETKKLFFMATVQGEAVPAAQMDAREQEARQRSENFHRSIEVLLKMEDRLDEIGQYKDGEKGTSKDYLTSPPEHMTRKSYLQRHRYELPQEQAQRFATTTGPWVDSGTMPETIASAPPHFPQEGTTTGAMAEFLGPDLTTNLPFITDEASSNIPMDPAMGDDFSWAVPRTAAEQEALIADFDKLIAESTASQVQPPVPAVEDIFSTTQVGELPSDLAMDDMMFDDMEMDFDNIFDMPMDDTFIPTTSAGT